MSKKVPPPRGFYEDAWGNWKWIPPDDMYVSSEGYLAFRPHPEAGYRQAKAREKDERNRGGSRDR